MRTTVVITTIRQEWLFFELYCTVFQSELNQQTDHTSICSGVQTVITCKQALYSIEQYIARSTANYLFELAVCKVEYLILVVIITETTQIIFPSQRTVPWLRRVFLVKQQQLEP